MKAVRIPTSEQSSEKGEATNNAPPPLVLPKSPLIACTAYCFVSMSMVLLNKAVLSGFDFPYTNTLLTVQTTFAVVFLYSLKMLGVLPLEDLESEKVRGWLPVTGLFVLMLWTGMFSLRYIPVAMFTVFKNMTNLVTAFGDKIMFGNNPPVGALVAMALMVLSSVVVAWYDLTFNWRGYIWITMNCFATASYALYMKVGMQKTKLSEFGMAFYNNTLSLPFFVLLVFQSGEHTTVLDSPLIWDPRFITCVFFSGMVGAMLNFATYWCARSTTPTTYSIVGSMNKVPIAIFGTVLFSTPMTPMTMASVGMGLLAGLIFGLSKTPMGIKGSLLYLVAVFEPAVPPKQGPASEDRDSV